MLNDSTGSDCARNTESLELLYGLQLSFQLRSILVARCLGSVARNKSVLIGLIVSIVHAKRELIIG